MSVTADRALRRLSRLPRTRRRSRSGRGRVAPRLAAGRPADRRYRATRLPSFAAPGTGGWASGGGLGQARERLDTTPVTQDPAAEIAADAVVEKGGPTGIRCASRGCAWT
ncbi:hypothetical protein ACH4U6_34695 [Streptomyces netropsis]|uniref:hypothetical protein n=1 Tax=Streptomyces netropsis TaxID=55404 RepID=UPI00378C66DF